MPDHVLFDALQVKLVLPADATEADADAARAALDDPTFLDSARRAVEAVVRAIPAPTVLTVTAEW